MLLCLFTRSHVTVMTSWAFGKCVCPTGERGGGKAGSQDSFLEGSWHRTKAAVMESRRKGKGKEEKAEGERRRRKSGRMGDRREGEESAGSAGGGGVGWGGAKGGRAHPRTSDRAWGARGLSCGGQRHGCE